MESASLLLIIIGAVIIAAVLVARLVLRRRDAADHLAMPRMEPEIDPLFADLRTELPAEPRLAREPSEAAPAMPPEEVPAVREQSVARRRPPRVAEDPRRVVVLNVVAGDAGFSGAAVRDALAGNGFEFGEWQIFHYYARNADAPPLFSLANMVKPGSFDLERIETMQVPGLSLFLVPAGEEGDLAAFETMLAVARGLAQELAGEVRDARRSVLTRQAIELIREQLKEWRCRVQAAQH